MESQHAHYQEAETEAKLNAAIVRFIIFMTVLFPL